MWECLHCGVEVEEVFAVCWRCQANRDGTPSELRDPSRDEREEDEIAVLNEWPEEEEEEVEEADLDEEFDEVDCLRCQAVMNYAGTRKLKEDSFSSAFGDYLRLEMYVCPACGHVEFFVPDP